jgi:hypothetical protein
MGCFDARTSFGRSLPENTNKDGLLVIVVVLEKCVFAQRIALTQDSILPSVPGGEPLCRLASLSVAGRRLPGMIEDAALTQRPLFVGAWFPSGR